MMDREDFRRLVQLGPLISIDLIVHDGSGSVLLGLRRNAPARGTWFVPGGRMHKGERFGEALQRISQWELGIALGPADVEPMGAFEHFYEENALDEPGFATHYVVLACRTRLSQLDLVNDENQHETLRFFTVEELLSHPHVHPNVKAYFDEAPENRFPGR